MSTERRVPEAGDPSFVVGLIGRTGSGKSSVARALARAGGVVIEADRLGHEVTDHDPEVRAALMQEYGAGIYKSDGTLDRSRVAARVFADPAARARLNGLVHPRIVERIRERLEKLRHAGYDGVVVLDAALLLDWGLERWCDAVIAVEADESDQLARLSRDRGWSAEEAGRRLSAQRPAAEFRAAADATVENRGSLAALEATARAVVTDLRGRRAARRNPC
jgi:dephospho-CoA kinase